jgi:uncharacterized protein
MAIFLKANWQELIMVNYEIPIEVLQPYLPANVELDLWNGKAWGSLVGFMFINTRIFNIPIPLLGSFEEINLRFYVKYKDGNDYKRGVVFINESVPYTIVASMANWLYKEHYTVLKTKHQWTHAAKEKQIQYEWKKKNTWFNMQVTAEKNTKPLAQSSFEEFIFEHYYGYTKVNNSLTLEYKVNHPKWLVNQVNNYTINCNFEEMYGLDFKFLNTQQPSSVFLAQGSPVTINWKRKKIKSCI